MILPKIIGIGLVVFMAIIAIATLIYVDRKYYKNESD